MQYGPPTYGCVDLMLHCGKARVHIHSDMNGAPEMRSARIAGYKGTAELDFVKWPVSNDDYMNEVKAFLSGDHGILASHTEALNVAKICGEIERKRR